MNPNRRLKVSLFSLTNDNALETVGYSPIEARDAAITPGKAFAIPNLEPIAAGAAHV